MRSWRCRAPTRDGAADLVQDGRRALLERWVDDVPFERVDRLQFVPPAVQTELPGRVDAGDGRRISEVDAGQSRDDQPSCAEAAGCAKSG